MKTYNVTIPFENAKARSHAKSAWGAKWNSVNKFWTIEVPEKYEERFQTWLKNFGLTLVDDTNTDTVDTGFGYSVKKSELANAMKLGFDGIE